MSNGIGPPPINRLPLGFLGLLDIKSGGRSPQEAAAFLQPVLDMSRFYVESSPEFINFNDTGVASAGGSFRNGFTVPQNEAWFVTNYAVKWVFNAIANEICNAVPAISTPSTPGISVPLGPAADTTMTTSLATNAKVGAAAIYRPFLANPGDRIGCLTMQIITATSITLVYSGRIQRLRV